MRRDIKKIIKKYPILNKEYDIPKLQKLAEEAAELGMRGIDKNLDEMGDYETRMLVSLMAMNQAIRSETFLQAAELSSGVFQGMIALELFDEARIFAMNLCSPDGGYATAAVALLMSCDLIIKRETYRGNADRLEKINEIRALLASEVDKNQEALMKNDSVFRARESLNQFKGWIAGALMAGSFIGSVMILLQSMSII